MKRTLIELDLDRVPAELNRLVLNSDVYDSSSSLAARVMFIDNGDGYYLKNAGKGSLKHEYEMTSYFHKKGLATEVLYYISDDSDWMLTKRIAGEDCTYSSYLDNPIRLVDTVGEKLRMLHSLDFFDCPVQNRTADYISTAERNYITGTYDKTSFPDSFGYASAENAWRVVDSCRKFLKNDTLIHGDYCLPNIMLDNWRFSGFVDLGNGGVGDRHIDLFWGAWTLEFNLKTDKYRDRFLDAYGREAVELDMLPIIAAFEVFG